MELTTLKKRERTKRITINCVILHIFAVSISFVSVVKKPVKFSITLLILVIGESLA